MVKYFAYGGNLLLRNIRSAAAAPGLRPLYAAYLKDAKMTFPVYDRKLKGGVASFSDAYLHKLWGAVFELDKKQMSALGTRLGEATGLAANPYEVVKVEVHTREGKAVKGVYAHRANAPTGSYYPPSKKYVDYIVRGAKDCGIPESFVSELSDMLSKL